VSNTNHILGISGSLRKGSYNSGLLRAAARLLPEDVSLDIFSLAEIPLFNQDLETDPPRPVREFRSRIAAAGGLLIATPEYNASVTGVLKNALDWASRPPRQSVLRGKFAAMMGAGGIRGTARSQAHLRTIAEVLRLQVLEQPEVLVARAWEKFDRYGDLMDEPTREQVRALVTVFVEVLRNREA
jgi:chromate reductase